VTRWVLGVDPALRCPGLAIAVGGVLVAADALAMPDDVNELPIGLRVDVVAQRCDAWFWHKVSELADRGRGHVLCGRPLVIYEKPQIYGGPRPEDPNDALHLAMVTASLWTILRATGCTQLLTPTPAEWTGGLKKSKKKGAYWTSPRGKHLARRVSAASAR
jgi:hypothetical protein